MSYLTSLLGFLSLLLFFVLELLKWILIPLILLLFGVYLVWKHSGLIRSLGVIFLLIFAYLNLSWVSPWYAIRRTDRVQDFFLDSQQLGEYLTVMWMDTPPRLLFVPQEDNPSTPERYNQKSKQTLVLVANLNTRQTQWLPKSAFNLSNSNIIKRLDDSDYTNSQFEDRGNLSLLYASPVKVGLISEFSFVGFSLPNWIYYLPTFSLIGGEQPDQPTGWQLKRTYFGWERLSIKESVSTSVVVEMNQIWFNRLRDGLLLNKQNWLFGGKFLVFEPRIRKTRHLFVLGPFNTSHIT